MNGRHDTRPHHQFNSIQFTTYAGYAFINYVTGSCCA
jgi:hypothetical protein